MNTSLIILTSISAIILSRAVNHDSVQSYKTGAFQEQSEFQLSKDQDLKLRDTSLIVRDTIKYVYVGAIACGSTCHNTEKFGFQHDIWKKSLHSKAFEVLKTEKALQFAKKANIKGNPQEIVECLKCHITGHGLDTKSYAATYSKEDGITCEACHKEEYETKTQWIGKHKTISRGLQPNEKTCLHCHINSIHKVKKFNYEVSFRKIDHDLPRYK